MFRYSDTETIRRLAAMIKSERDVSVADSICRLRAINNELDNLLVGWQMVEFEKNYGNWISELERYSNTLYSIHQFLIASANYWDEFDGPGIPLLRQ